MTDLSPAAAFFYEHAGYSYDPKIETEDEGRIRGAQELANAEDWAKENWVSYSWADDHEGMRDHQWDFVLETEEVPETCEEVYMYLDSEMVGYLGCIDDASPEYRRVIEAELASEYISTIPEDVLSSM